MDEQIMINALVELAGLEDELLAAREILQRHARRHRHLDELAQELEHDADEAGTAARRATVEQRSRDAAWRELERNLAAKREQLVGLSDRRQHRALCDEIAALERRLEAAEAEAWQSLDTAEQEGEQAAAARRDRERQAVRSLDELAELDRRAVQAQAAEQELQAEIARLHGLLPPGVARHAARLAGRYDRAVVHVVDGACGGCFGQLPPQQGLDAAQGRAAVRCPHCQRFVVRARRR